jgi:hypothetical protein
MMISILEGILANKKILMTWINYNNNIIQMILNSKILSYSKFKVLAPFEKLSGVGWKSTHILKENIVNNLLKIYVNYSKWITRIRQKQN